AVTLAPALMLLLIRRPVLSRPFDSLRSLGAGSDGEGSPARKRSLAALGTKITALLAGTIHSEEKHPISRLLFRLYGPPAHWVLRHTRLVIVLAVIVVLVTLPIYFRLGHEFMPPLNEGVILYMPTTL